jgi:serine kinase of HPr protein (carbohydrate metabolism regulator)
VSAAIRHAGLVARRAEGRWRGVLIEGPSGAGKSDLALRMMQSGFRLVADDRVVAWADRGRLYGRAPDPLRDLIEVRGVGVLAEPALAFAEVGLLVYPGAPERMPDPAFEAIGGVRIPRLMVEYGHASAPLLIARALMAFDAAHKRRI